MDIEALLRAVADYFQTFDGAKALQVAYYSVALVLASIGLWKAIRFAESSMPKRLLEFASRFEGRIVEKKLKALGRIKLVPMVPQSTEYLDVNAEIDRAIRYLDKGDAENAASELERLAVRLEEKIGVVERQLSITRQQTASVQLLFGSLARKVPQRADQSLGALRRAIELMPADPEGYREIGIVEKEAGAVPRAISAFEDYWKAANALDPKKRPDKKLLLIEAHELTAECYRARTEPDNERHELKAALDVAETIDVATLKPHVAKARLLEALGENAKNRTPPQKGNMDKYFRDSAAEYTLAGLADEAARVREKNGKAAA